METPITRIRAKGLPLLNFDEEKPCPNKDLLKKLKESGAGRISYVNSRKEKEI